MPSSSWQAWHLLSSDQPMSKSPPTSPLSSHVKNEINTLKLLSLKTPSKVGARPPFDHLKNTKIKSTVEMKEHPHSGRGQNMFKLQKHSRSKDSDKPAQAQQGLSLSFLLFFFFLTTSLSFIVSARPLRERLLWLTLPLFRKGTFPTLPTQ